jgi:murein L,D-transpeptidase YafK
MHYQQKLIMIKFNISTALLMFASVGLSQCTDSTTVTLVEDSTSRAPYQSLRDIMKENHIAKSEISVLVDKSDYTVTVIHEDTNLIIYPCVFGFDAISDKAQEGDGCTPEGVFGIRSKYSHRSWKYFIWIDYPNRESWTKFKTGKTNGEIPSSATIGGEIGVHGVPEGMDFLIAERSNWTLGCVSLTNRDIEDLYKSLGEKTQFKIQP